MSTKQKILFIFTSADKDVLGQPTGWYLPEAAHPYYVLAPHYDIDFAAPAGPNPPIDQYSVETFKDDESVKFLNDDVVKEKLAKAFKLTDLKAEDYAAVFYPGGHGPVIDLPTDAASIKLSSDFFRAGKPTAAVCHGPAVFVNVLDSNNLPIFKNRTVAGFSNAEEEQAGKTKNVPWLLEDKILEKGGTYVKAKELWAVSAPSHRSSVDEFLRKFSQMQEKVAVDGNLITGQNPASAKGVGVAILRQLQGTA
ncbi:hypothetical protein M407DRAFT_211742 [Tulasnella calospora MUT 4182]|uniref:D-lactate dehydratase n=1 Tax=Tulasnella calospora MUT 4182 TaxID=1051891 RepID=A0A0C3LU91_9AGAM|nr:hypothetical protein M407DRAFT_211742 [Tulasnella calospora MUT 4182]